MRNLSQSTIDNGNNTILNQTENIDKSSSINPDSFLSNNIKLAEKTINLGIESPFKLEVESEFDSKINVKIIENKITTYERISSLPAGRKRSWDSIGTLQFELSSVQGINVTLNGNDRIISQFLKPDNISEEDVSIRVILKEDGYLTTVYFGIN